MGRLQSSVGLITGTDIAGTVEQLIKLSARPRDRLVARTETLQREQTSLAELTATVIGVQLSGNKLSSASAFRSKKADSTNKTALTAVAGNNAVAGKHVVRTLATAATHTVRSLQRFESAETALGLSGKISIHPDGGFVDGSAELSKLNDGRGVEPGIIRITDRSGATAEIDLSSARTIDDVLTAINDAAVDVRATTNGNAIELTDLTGSRSSNLRVEQLGLQETAADLGLHGIDANSDTATGIALELPAGVSALRGTALSELGGGGGIGPLGDLDITLSDGSSAQIDLSAATTTSEVIDAIDAAGLSLIVKYNEAKNGFQIRDVSGGNGNLIVSSSDDTASSLGLQANTANDILVGGNLNRQTVTADTLLSKLNDGAGIKGSFTITDSNGGVAAINLAAAEITTVGGLIDAINNSSIGVTAALNESGDGISVVDTAAGAGTLKITDSGTGTAAKDLGIAGTATNQTIGGSTVSALVGTQAGVINVEATDTLATLVAKINDDGRYGTASIETNGDGTVSLRIRSKQGGEAGRFAINASGFDLDLRTDSLGQDASIAVSTDGATERFLKSSDGVFKLDDTVGSAGTVTSNTLLANLASSASGGSFTITDSAGVTSAINLTTQGITTVGGLVDAINALDIGVDAAINEAGTGIAVIDTAAGSGTMKIADVGNGKATASLGIAGTAKTQTIGGQSVSALVGPVVDSAATADTGLVFTLKELADSPITVTVTDDTNSITTNAKSFVDQYNKLVDKLQSLTFYNADSEEVGLLFGSSEALRIGSGYTRLLSGTIQGAGELKSIGQIGMRLNDQGKLELDQTKLTEALADDHTAVEEFFTSAETGLASRLNALADRIAGVDGGLLINRTKTLTTQIERNADQIDSLNVRLEKERERLLTQFYKTEEAIAKIQSNSSAINQIERLTIPT